MHTIKKVSRVICCLCAENAMHDIRKNPVYIGMKGKEDDCGAN